MLCKGDAYEKQRSSSIFCMGKCRALSLLLLLLLITPALCACAALREEGSMYAFKDSRYAFDATEGGVKAVELFDVQAQAAVESGLGRQWLPQYLLTVVIAIDRDQTDAQIQSWKDIAAFSGLVGMSTQFPEAAMLWAALSFDADKRTFSMPAAAQFLHQLYERDRLRFDDMSAALFICFDYQALQWMQEGRNLEIVIPAEGSLSFAKGLLLKNEGARLNSHEMDSPALAALEQNLLNAGFRLPDGRCAAPFYPPASAYSRAFRLTDYRMFNQAALQFKKLFRRVVLNQKRFDPVDGREFVISVLLLLLIIVLWTGNMYRRISGQFMRRIFVWNGVLLMGWILLRLLKRVNIHDDQWIRFAWYGYYIFMVPLALLFLWMTMSIDQPTRRKPSAGLCVFAFLNLLLLLLILSNDGHMLAFRFDPLDPLHTHNYRYGPIYYLLAFNLLLAICVAVVVLLVKSYRNAHKTIVVFPALVTVALLVYFVSYALAIPLARESDMTLITCLIVLLFYESALQSGLIPINSKYAKLFSASSLNMQLLDLWGRSVLLSEGASALTPDLRGRIASVPTRTKWQEGDITVYADPIAGGYVVWQEDIREIHSLQEEMKDLVLRLDAANRLLSQEENVRGKLLAVEARTALLKGMENEIAGKWQEMTRLIESYPNGRAEGLAAAQLALLAVYIKRRCNLFFLERDSASISVKKFEAHLAELLEFADYASLRCVMTHRVSGQRGEDLFPPISIRQASLFFDFFYQALIWAIGCGCSYLLEELVLEGEEESEKEKKSEEEEESETDARERENLLMYLMLSERAKSYQPDEKLQVAVMEMGGRFSFKELDHAQSLSLSFSLVKGRPPHG